VIETYEVLTPDITGICEAVKKRNLWISHYDPVAYKSWIAENRADPICFTMAHHLVTDGISWRILLEDLYTACNKRLKEARYDHIQKNCFVA